MNDIALSKISYNVHQRQINICVSILVVLCFIRIVIFESFWDYLNNYLSLFLAIVSAFTMVVAFLLVHRAILRSIKILSVLLVLALLLSFFVNESGLEYICNTVTVLGLFAVLPYTKLEFKTIILFTVCFVTYGILLILFAPKFDKETAAIMNVNTNASSFVMFYLMCIMFVFAIRSKRKMLFIIFALVAFAFQFSFVGRSTLIGSALFLIYLIFRKFCGSASKNAINVLQLFLCVFAILFAYFYAVILYEAAGYGTIVIFGKDIFTGRQIIWNEAFEQIKGHLLLGIGNVLTAGDYVGTVNIHNQMLGYLVCFGLIATIIIIVLIGLTVSYLYERKQSNLSVAFISIVIIVSYFETVFYSSVDIVLFIIPLVVIYTVERKIQLNGVKVDNQLLLARTN